MSEHEVDSRPSGASALGSSVSSGSNRPANGGAPGNAAGNPAGNPAGIGDELYAACREIIAPLIHADGGHLYIVSSSAGELHLHLTGTCAGCPGASITRDKIIQPAIAGAAPGMNVKLTTGWNVPHGGTKIEPA